MQTVCAFHTEFHVKSSVQRLLPRLRVTPIREGPGLNPRPAHGRGKIRVRIRHQVEADPRRPLLIDAQTPGRCIGEIDNPSRNEGTTIIDANHDASTVIQARDPDSMDRVREQVRALYAFLTEIELQRVLEQKAEALGRDGRLAEMQEHAQVWNLLIELLDKHRDERALVFGRTKHGSEKLMKTLEKRGFATVSIHGNNCSANVSAMV